MTPSAFSTQSCQETPKAIQLPADVEARIQEKVESGRFPDAGEVVREVLRLLDDHDRKRQRLLAALAEGQQGEGIPYTRELLDAIDGDVDERLRRGDRPNPDVCP